ncbi:MAG TPA: GNA1162 family protein [Syntrophales bacterium]|nr:GNA1162 family protein [Syntrophales bacterium]
MGRFIRLLKFIIVLSMITGCASKIPDMVNSDHGKKGTRLIAILPVNNMTANVKAGQVLREAVLNELYFKGYPKIPLNVIDEKLSKVFKEEVDSRRVNIPPTAIGELLGVDAVMYTTLDECSTSYNFIYAPTRVSVVLELRSAKTGETLWNSKYGTVKRNYGMSREQLEMASCQVFEPAIQEVVEKAMKTLPDGPDSTT